MCMSASMKEIKFKKEITEKQLSYFKRMLIKSLEEINKNSEIKTIQEFNPKHANALQDKAFHLIRVLSMRRFDPDLAYDFLKHIQKMGMEPDSFEHADSRVNQFILTYNILLNSICKILAGKPLDEKEIKILPKLRDILLFLQSDSDSEIANVHLIFDEFIDLLKNPKALHEAEKTKQNSAHSIPVLFSMNGAGNAGQNSNNPPAYEQSQQKDEMPPSYAEAIGNGSKDPESLDHDTQIALAIAQSLEAFKASPAKKS